MNKQQDREYGLMHSLIEELDRPPSHIQQRLRDIEDNIHKDQELLKRCEDARRTERLPHLLTEYENQIQEIKQRVQNYKEERLILQQQIEANKNIPYKLTQITPNFVGKKGSLESLSKMLRKYPGWCRIAGLYGSPGSGKSALACFFAQHYQQELFPEGVIAIDLRLYNDYKGRDKLNEIAKAFIAECPNVQFTLSEQRNVVRMMRDIFRERRMLLIFDNAENTEIKDLFPDGNQCAIIVTTRERELLNSIIPQPWRGILPRIEEFSEEEAIQFFKQLLEEDLSDDEPIKKVVKLLNNLPLALEIAGRQLNARFVRYRDSNAVLLTQDIKINLLIEYADLLAQEQAKLIEKLRIRVSGVHYLDIRSSFSLSLRFLTTEEVNFLVGLSVCQHEEFSPYEAQAAIGCDQEITGNYLEYLEQLSLIKTSSRRRNYYVFQPLIHKFTQDIARYPNLYELNIEPTIIESSKKRYLQFLTQLKKYKHLSTHSSQSNIETNFESFLEAAEWFLKYKIPEYKLIDALLPYFEKRGYWKRAVKLIEGFQILARFLKHDKIAVNLLMQQAKYLSLDGDHKTAQNILQLAENLLDDVDDLDFRNHAKAKIFQILGVSLHRQGEFHNAEQKFLDSIHLKEELNDLLGLGITYNSLGVLQIEQKRWDDGIANISRSVEIGKRLNNKAHLAKALTTLGGVFYQQQKYSDSENIFKESLNLEKERKNRKGEGMVLNSLAEVQIKLNNIEEGKQNFQLSLSIKEEVGDVKGKAIQLHSFGRLLLQQNQFNLALKYLKDSISIFEETLHDERSSAIVHTTLGKAFLKQKRLDDAIKELGRGFEIEEKIRNQRGIEIVLPVLIETLIKLGRRKDALSYCHRAIAISEVNRCFLHLCS
ncbi:MULTISPECIES: tetratricopeptide repeat protein [Nostoc]|uniref:Tetratricopeptide repeat protein n=1 Tax=Nostoc paludosum FACHB-159 TaxID=2692908 RepID=A0ABR8KA73_9NOSO|nr:MULTISPECIES: tetratricopeptide repeat protein [Nostoc]MBD2676835.1 tetratricopeptide repeat protein [Nostoc sp. FACHB-857]MBD2735022.1 tetratricopeptide repeat protein [Nostoc paludosum FACHB-159]